MTRPRPGAGLATRDVAGVAVTPRDVLTHGDWQKVHADLLEALRRVGLYQGAMLGGLTAANASRTQISDVSAWSDKVSSTARYISQKVGEIDARIGPLIDAIALAGGVDEVADASYHADY
jgi:hypothetical protein